MPLLDPAVVRVRLDAVIAALKATGAWEVARPPEAAFADAGAFGTRTMALEQWLRFVFVPNIEALLGAGGPWPASSAVAVHAVREWDGWEHSDAPVAALRRFDALFRPDAMTASEHNQAGWELLKTATHLADAMTYFRAALELAPDDGVPLANLCDALVAAGQLDEAIATAERETTGPRAAAAHNWLGWRLMNQPEARSHAIDHLYAATQARPTWGIARMNFGKALELAHRADEAFVQLTMALRCDGDFDRAFCHERRGAYHARHGWFRNALVAMRAALRADSGARRAPYEEGIAWIEQQLRAAGIEPPADETRKTWTEACERELPPGFMATNELGEPLTDDVIEVERLVRAERWAEVAAHLAKLPPMKRWDAVGFAERGAERALRVGHRVDAILILEQVLDAYRFYASGATSGAEGLGRMADVERVRRTLAEWSNEA